MLCLSLFAAVLYDFFALCVVYFSRACVRAFGLVLGALLFHRRNLFLTVYYCGKHPTLFRVRCPHTRWCSSPAFFYPFRWRAAAACNVVLSFFFRSVTGGRLSTYLTPSQGVQEGGFRPDTDVLFLLVAGSTSYLLYRFRYHTIFGRVCMIVLRTNSRHLMLRDFRSDRDYVSGATFGALICNGSGSLARVTALLFCGLYFLFR